MGNWFDANIIDTGRLPLFCFFAAFLATFVFIRFSVRMIRAEVSWWPGNVSPGGLHIHHVVFGVVAMVISGISGLAVPDQPIGWRTACAVVFGIGTALVLDEFALILRLEDVYWSTAGRLSVDAVVIAGAMTGLLLLGVVPSIADNVAGFAQSDDSSSSASGLVIGLIVDFLLAAVAMIKGKIWTGLFGIFVPILLFVGAIRLARPNSPWARRRYASRPKKAARAAKREERYHRPIMRAKARMEDLVAGRMGEGRH